VVVAVAGATARQVSAMAVPLARARGQAVHVVNVIETDVLAGEDTAELETRAEANALLDACIGELREAGVPVSGELLHSYGTHIDVARQILRRAADLRAGAIVLGPDTHQTPANDVSAYVAGHAPCHVIVINPRAGALGRPMPSATFIEPSWSAPSKSLCPDSPPPGSPVVDPGVLGVVEHRRRDLGGTGSPRTSTSTRAPTSSSAGNWASATLRRRVWAYAQLRTRPDDVPVEAHRLTAVEREVRGVVADEQRAHPVARTLRAGPGERRGADERLVLGDAEPHAAFVWRVRGREVAAEVAIALLDPQRLEHPVATGADVVRLARGPDPIPHLHGPLGRHVELEPELADERDALRQDRCTAIAISRAVLNGIASFGEVVVGDLHEHLRAFGPQSPTTANGAGHVLDLHGAVARIEVQPQPPQVRVDGAGPGHDPELVRQQAA
jgi:hypothetical protein